ncbi:hypothetical protein ACHAXS_002234 [Conticribra weissflogii]
MAFALMSLHNTLSSCCGESGNLFAKIFHKNDDDDAAGNIPAAAAAAAMGGGAAAAAPTFGGITDKQAKYQNVTWSKLPVSARKAAKVLGFEEHQWDEAIGTDAHPHHPPPPHIKHVLDRPWKDLTEEQRSACETLGWDEASWDLSTKIRSGASFRLM